jgi:hypothetical protein
MLTPSFPVRQLRVLIDADRRRPIFNSHSAIYGPAEAPSGLGLVVAKVRNQTDWLADQTTNYPPLHSQPGVGGNRDTPPPAHPCSEIFLFVRENTRYPSSELLCSARGWLRYEAELQGRQQMGQR